MSAPADGRLARAVRTERFAIAPALGGRLYGIGLDDDDRLDLLRYASLVELTADDLDYWSLDLLPWRPDAAAEDPNPLFLPPPPALPRRATWCGWLPPRAPAWSSASRR